jgi:exonuclease III
MTNPTMFNLNVRSLLFTLLIFTFITPQSMANYDNAVGALKKTYDDMFHLYENLKIEHTGVGSEKLKVVTINFGFLNEKLLQKEIKVPEFEKRTEEIKDQLMAFLSSEKPDILFCQEVWYSWVLKKFYEAIDELSTTSNKQLEYEPAFARTRAEFVEKKGLFYLVKKSILQPGVKYDEAKFREFSDKAAYFYPEWLKGYLRGILGSVITLKSGARVFIGTTHLTPMYTYQEVFGRQPGEIEIRDAQAAQSARIIDEYQNLAEYVIYGGDFNSAPEHDCDRDGPCKMWESNEQPYITFAKDSRLIDTFRVANPNVDGETWQPHENPITYYSVKTPAQRIDFIWAGPFSNELKFSVLESRLVFKEPLKKAVTPFRIVTLLSSLLEPPRDEQNRYIYDKDPTEKKAPLFLSDHYGLLSSVEFQNPDPKRLKDRKRKLPLDSLSLVN